jgi:prolipoprotein diacylglyceryltransferase
VLFINARRGGRYNFSLYIAVYGIWRFFVEYLRGDYRGSVGLAVTPSQLIALLMIAASVAIFFLEKLFWSRKAAREAQNNEKNGEIIEN